MSLWTTQGQLLQCYRRQRSQLQVETATPAWLPLFSKGSEICQLSERPPKGSHVALVIAQTAAMSAREWDKLHHNSLAWAYKDFNSYLKRRNLS